MAKAKFADRFEAGRRLAVLLDGLDGDVVVLAVTRQALPVAFEVARALDARLDGVPGDARAWRGEPPRIELAGREVLLVDDGTCKPARFAEAAAAVRALGARRLTAAFPATTRELEEEAARTVEEIHVAEPGDPSYGDDSPVTGELAAELLERALELYATGPRVELRTHGVHDA
ncbi:hypothetical protein JDY09_02775 [Thermoleophilum album]|jgi:predicted phosphoribosyltransferase|uniref:hypothetical protein n=1 Tax=Thermoleophilum album TaxID=29539 RepID=UPI00237CA405|nr:hypothetical protein [Thermoleophilum album]WDT94194.1 hypothetical protein JDY09_02775 [Thermoleophilum album]